MNTPKLLRFSIRLATSLTSTRQLAFNSPTLTQVTQFHHFSPIRNIPQITCNYFNSNKRVSFSTNSQSFTDLVLCNDWSEEIEIELEKLDPKLTHESIVYVLMKLDPNPKKSFDFFKWVSVRKGFDPSYVPYRMILRVLACDECVNDFWVVALEMKEKGFYFDTQLYFAVLTSLKRAKSDKFVEDWVKFYKTLCNEYDSDEVVKHVVNLILECDWSEDVECKLKGKLEFPLSENFVIRVLKELEKQQLKALRFFEWISNRGGYKHDSVTYNTMLKILGLPNSVNEFWDLVNRMKSEGFEVDFCTLMKAFWNLPIDVCVQLFEIMMDGTHKPSLPECSMLLQKLSREEYLDIDLAYRIINKCVAQGDRLSKKEYDITHRILCKIGKFDESKKIMQEMIDAGYEPDNITYSQQISGLCKQKNFEEACNVLKLMELNACIPDVTTWTVLIQGYCLADQVDEALSCLGRMREKNVEPDAVTLDVLIYGFLSKDKVLGAFKFLIEMVNKVGIKPWRGTYTLMIDKLVKVGKIEEALDLLRLMKTHRHPQYSDPITKHISKSGTVDDARKLLMALSNKDAPSNVAYIKVIKSFLDEGREKEAKELLFSIPYGVRNSMEIRKVFGSGSCEGTYKRSKRAPLSKKEGRPGYKPHTFVS